MLHENDDTLPPSGLTLYEKLWRRHVIRDPGDGTGLLYIDRHLIHEVSSPQAFQGLQQAGRDVWRRKAALVMPDHNVPTTDRGREIEDPTARHQLQALITHVQAFDLDYIPLHDVRQGIVHVVGPEQGFTLPGLTVVCGDSHTSTHGALACLAFGIGTSQVEHVLATQTLWVEKARTMRVRVHGRLPAGVTSKDLALTLIRRIGAGGATGYAIEFQGSAVLSLDMEARMTLCNMAIEAGARSAMVAVDDVTLDYVRGKPLAPSGSQWQQAETYWRTLVSDVDAVFDTTIDIDATGIAPQVTWGTSPQMVADVTDSVPVIDGLPDAQRADVRHALDYMGLQQGEPLCGIAVDRVFIGSCTNSRLGDLRAAAGILRGRRIAAGIRQAIVVPGSGQVKAQAEAEGLDRIFLDAGFEWREPGCSMCIGMNGDMLQPGERCASTSNRNFEGRQGPGGRTHLVSPAMAAAAAVAGHFVDVRQWMQEGA